MLSEAKKLDAALFAAVAASGAPPLDAFMRRLSRATDHGKLWFGVAGALFVIGGPSDRRAARRGLASLMASGLVILVAKPVSGRRRPARMESEELYYRHVRMPRTSSFPSGHTASAFAFATGAANAQPALSTPLRALASLVGYSRVHTGVHYPADVLAGALIGVSAASFVTRLGRAGERLRPGRGDHPASP